ncbi:uncharacterized protein LOC123293927 isoform X1 [Chrysoperla carnea]|uniref:uncharacterized protein LOC123293927 isoform X1 n=1 Tax=Chrysoperla carnea TaxID=189513 RepID=UPI001D06BC14|nr:uncharacterized protein LOC123293927 isoform X1 [Chrysoperla carnea]
MDRLSEKEKERQIHTALYNNVALLCTAHDNPKLCDGSRLQTHLRPDMFINANKFAFEQITYFLLNIIDPNLIKSVPWPLLDKKLESEFRSKVKQILNDLNSKYKDARIPATQTSQMLTPGGIKIARILFYLSELTILVYMKKLLNDDEDDEPIFLPFVAGANASDQLQNVDNVIKYENKKSWETYFELNNQISETMNTAKNYASKLSPLMNEVEELKQTSKEINDDNFLESVLEITKSLNEVKGYEMLIEDTRNAIHSTVTNVNNSGFTFEKDSFDLRQNLARKILNDQNELNIKELLILIDSVLKDFIVNLTQQPMFDLTQLDDFSIKIVQDYELFLHKIETTHNPELKELNTLLRENIDKYNEELLKKFNADDTYLKKLTTPELEFNIPITANDFRSKLTGTSFIRRSSFFDTLTTAKKRAKRANDNKMASSVKRNLMGDNKSVLIGDNKSGLLVQPPNANSTMKILTPSSVDNRPPNASSTPEVTISKPLSGHKHGSKIRQLLTNSPLTEVSTQSESFNISQEILDVLQLNDELDSSEMFPSASKF